MLHTLCLIPCIIDNNWTFNASLLNLTDHNVTHPLTLITDLELSAFLLSSTTTLIVCVHEHDRLMVPAAA